MYQSILFVIAALLLILLAIRNITWSYLKEEDRSKQSSADASVRRSTLISGALVLLLGGLFIVLSSNLRFPIIWFAIGAFFVISGIFGISAGLFVKHSLLIENWKVDSDAIRKRLTEKRFAGWFQLLLLSVWLYSGAANYI